MRAVTCFIELKFGAACYDFFAKGDEGLNNIAKRERLRAPPANCQHIGRETGLSRRVSPDLVENNFGRRIAFQVDHHANALARAFIANIRYAFDALFLGGIGDLLDQASFTNLVRDRSQND